MNCAILFGQSGRWTTATQNVASPFSLNSLFFFPASNVTAVSGSPLAFSFGSGSDPLLSNNSATNVTVSNSLVVSHSAPVGPDRLLVAAVNGLLTLAGPISGSNGQLIKLGSGIVVLQANNTYGSGTEVQEGTLRLASPGALGSAGSISFTGGTLQYTAFSTTDYSDRFSGDVRIDTNEQVVTFAGGIGGSSLTKTGTGTLILAGTAANTYAGLTSITAGTLALGCRTEARRPAEDPVLGRRRVRHLAEAA